MERVRPGVPGALAVVEAEVAGEAGVEEVVEADQVITEDRNGAKKPPRLAATRVVDS